MLCYKVRQRLNELIFSANSDITVLFVGRVAVSIFSVHGTYYDEALHSSHELIIDLNKNRLQQQYIKNTKEEDN